MTNKTTVLRHLDQYRDKTLGFGCEVKNIKSDVEDIVICHRKWATPNEYELRCYSGFYSEKYILERYEILGKPATISTLLIALAKSGNDTLGGFVREDNVWVANYMDKLGAIEIPLDTPLTEIPETDKLWGQLLNLFELKV